MISPFGRNRSSRKVKVHDLPQRGISLRTESTTETTASLGGEIAQAGEGDAAAAALVEVLISHGVGKSAAERFAREKPDICRRCLDYLPFAKLRSTKGAWLANAIRDEYGPPPGFEAERARIARTQEARERVEARSAVELRERAIREEETARLESGLRRLEEGESAAYSAFCSYVEAERDRVPGTPLTGLTSFATRFTISQSLSFELYGSGTSPLTSTGRSMLTAARMFPSGCLPATRRPPAIALSRLSAKTGFTQ